MERSSGLFAVTQTARKSDVLSKWMVNWPTSAANIWV